MALLQIKKLSTKVWEHIADIGGSYVLTKFMAKKEFNKFFIVEVYGSKRFEYSINEIEVYDIGGVAETFTNFEDLFLRLEILKYTGFYIDGEFTFNPSSYDLSEFQNSEVDRFAKLSDITAGGGALRTHTIVIRIPSATTATNNWQTFQREVTNIYTLGWENSSSYNSILDTHSQPRCSQWILPFKCRLIGANWVFNTLSSASYQINVFTALGGNISSFTNGKTIASKSFDNPTGLRKFLEYSGGEIDTVSVMAKNDIITLACNNNNISTGDLRSNTYTLIFEEVL